MGRVSLILIFLLGSLFLHAQEERVTDLDTNRLQQPTPILDHPSQLQVSDYYISSFLPRMAINPPEEQRWMIPHYHYSPDKGLPNWSNGSIFATSQRTYLPGLMGIERGAIGISHSLGNWTFQLGANANKYGYFNGQLTIFGLSGSASYRINDHLSLTAYGNFYTRNPYITPAMMPMIGSNNFGGFLTYKFDSHWGFDAGVSTVYNSYTRRYDVRPNFTPFYEFKPGTKIGVDVGSILYEILRSANVRGTNPGGATIGPPIPMGPPPVR